MLDLTVTAPFLLQVASVGLASLLALPSHGLEMSSPMTAWLANQEQVCAPGDGHSAWHYGSSETREKGASLVKAAIEGNLQGVGHVAEVEAGPVGAEAGIVSRQVQKPAGINEAFECR